MQQKSNKAVKCLKRAERYKSKTIIKSELFEIGNNI